MDKKRSSLNPRAAFVPAASIGLICLFVAGVQPALDFLFADGALFVASSEARARDATDSTEASPATEPQSVPNLQADRTASDPFANDPMARLALALQNRQEELRAREGALDRRKRELDELARSIEERIARMESLAVELTRLSQERDAERKREIRKWVAIFEAMQPDPSGRMLADLKDPELSLEVLIAMQPAKAAAILNAMVAAHPPTPDGIRTEVQILAATLARGLERARR
jgi:flagellar motility protein MotE (MotC chaperone)